MQVSVKRTIATATVRPAKQDEVQRILERLQRTLEPAAQAVARARQLSGGSAPDAGERLWNLYAEVDRARHVLDDAVFELRLTAAELKDLIRRNAGPTDRERT